MLAFFLPVQQALFPSYLLASLLEATLKRKTESNVMIEKAKKPMKLTLVICTILIGTSNDGLVS